MAFSFVREPQVDESQRYVELLQDQLGVLDKLREVSNLGFTLEVHRDALFQEELHQHSY